ncbi:hypothetical protein [Streptomyces hydrogenans]|uniref:hypothetical protein n=1 Tax=Streptomyces hydrogenans TaxID=1873719 RepID=UPI003416840F
MRHHQIGWLMTPNAIRLRVTEPHANQVLPEYLFRYLCLDERAVRCLPRGCHILGVWTHSVARAFLPLARARISRRGVLLGMTAEQDMYFSREMRGAEPLVERQVYD